MWKSAEDAEAGAQPHLVLLVWNSRWCSGQTHDDMTHISHRPLRCAGQFDRPGAVIDTSEDKTFKFQVRGITSSGGEGASSKQDIHPRS